MSGINRFVNKIKYGSGSRVWSFYKTYLSKGDRCFDIGAHKGEISKVLLKNGCSVVGFEPLDSCKPQLGKLQQSWLDRFIYEHLAISDKAGKFPFFKCNYEEVSTLSNDFIEKYGTYDYLKWEQEIMVNTITIEDAIQRHGVPRFIKIDTEGFENVILKELNHSVPFIQFEWNELLMDVAIETMRSLEKLDNYQFNWWPGELYVLSESEFLSSEQICKILNERPENVRTGEIFAKLSSAL